MLSGDNSILQRATDAKTKSDEAQIKERVRLAYSSALAKDLTNGNGDLTKPTLDEEINNEFGSSGKVEKDGDEWVIYVDNNEIERISIPESALKPTLISQGAKVGDYVNYNASSGNGANLQVTASDIAEIVQTINNTDDDTKFAGGATISGTFKSNEITKWRIISTENGIIKLMGEVPTTQTVTLQGTEGFKKSIQVLDKISEIYGKGNGATGAKCISLNDLDLNFGNGGITITNTQQTFESGSFFKQIKENGDVIDYEDSITEASSSNNLTLQNTGFFAGGPIMFNSLNQTIWWSMFQKASATNSGFWVSSRVVFLDGNRDYAGFMLLRGASGGLGASGDIFDSNKTYNTVEYGVIPVITLKNEIRGEKSQDGSWNLDV